MLRILSVRENDERNIRERQADARYPLHRECVRNAVGVGMIHDQIEIAGRGTDAVLDRFVVEDVQSAMKAFEDFGQTIPAEAVPIYESSSHQWGR